MPSGPSIGKNFEATTVSQSFKAVSDSFSMYQMKLSLHLKQLKRHTFPKALTKAPSRGKEQAAHVDHDQVGHCEYASSCLGTEPEAAVEDYLDVRDIALTQLLEVESCMRVDVEPSNFGLEWRVGAPQATGVQGPT